MATQIRNPFKKIKNYKLGTQKTKEAAIFTKWKLCYHNMVVDDIAYRLSNISFRSIQQ